MTKTALTILAVISTLVLGGIGLANAASITETCHFTASGFTPSGSPVDPWTGSFTITFDPTVASSGALNAFSSNLPASYGTFKYNRAGVVGAFGGMLEIGNDCTASGCGALSGEDTAVLFISTKTSGDLIFMSAALGSTSSNSLFSTPPQDRGISGCGRPLSSPGR